MPDTSYARDKEKAKRNRAIKRDFNAGKKPVTMIAEEHGMSEARIYQIGNNPNADKVRPKNAPRN